MVSDGERYVRNVCERNSLDSKEDQECEKYSVCRTTVSLHPECLREFRLFRSPHYHPPSIVRQRRSAI